MRSPRDKGRVERAVPGVRDDCFAGEEQARLLPAPTTPYDIPLWSEPKVGCDQLAAVDKALYSIPHPYVGQRVTARADAQMVRFYARGLLIKTHPRTAPGGQSIDANDYPVERSVYAMRNVDALRRQAESASDVIGRYAAALLDSPLPWTRMRRVYALLGLVRRYGAARVTDVCTVALAADMLDMHRLRRMLEHGITAAPPTPPARAIPPGRYLRPSSQYQLPFLISPRCEVADRQGVARRCRSVASEYFGRRVSRAFDKAPYSGQLSLVNQAMKGILY